MRQKKRTVHFKASPSDKMGYLVWGKPEDKKGETTIDQAEVTETMESEEEEEKQRSRVYNEEESEEKEKKHRKRISAWLKECHV